MDRITARQFELQTERGAPPRVIWFQEAGPPQAPVEAIPVRQMGLAALLGLGLPLALAVGWERHVGRITDSESLRRQSFLAVLGETARLPVRSRTGRAAAQVRMGRQLRMFEESIDSLRTSLTLSEELRGMRILAITSAANHEGKTSVAAQLAISLARATGEPTLLIDGDLRSPDIHRLFEVPLAPGVVEVLGGQSALETALVTTWDPRVHLLPAGRLQGNPHWLLGNGNWKAMMGQVPGIYRYVIVDTPPVLPASESLVLAKAADAALVCVMRDVSRADHVQKATERLLAAGAHPVGAVLNGVPTKEYGYS